MSNLIYLISSLPSLSYGQVSPISMDEFNQDAKNQLSTKHFKELETVDIQKGCEIAKSGSKDIVAMIKAVQHDISEIREARMQNREVKLERLPKTVLTTNPLEREKQIMHWQWQELVSIEAGKTFTLTEVIVYKLKLQILYRLNSFKVKSGLQVLESVINPSKIEEEKEWQE